MVNENGTESPVRQKFGFLLYIAVVNMVDVHCIDAARFQRRVSM